MLVIVLRALPKYRQFKYLAFFDQFAFLLQSFSASNRCMQGKALGKISPVNNSSNPGVGISVRSGQIFDAVVYLDGSMLELSLLLLIIASKSTFCYIKY